MDFPPNILRRLFFSRAGLSSPHPMEASGSLVKSKQRQECWWGLHLYPGPFFFALLHPRNLPEGPSVVEAFSSSLDVCGMNPAVASASKHLHFTPSVSVHTCTHLNWVFVTFSVRQDRFVPSWANPSQEEAVFFICLHSGGNSITCTLLWNWNWHLASHCFFQAALMCFQKGRCVRVCRSVCVFWLFSFMCVGICLMCVQPYGAGRWIP